MQIEPTDISEELRRKAKVCETIAQDKTEESLTGASCEKQINEQEAKTWQLKSEVWIEAAVIAAAGTTGQSSPATDPNAAG